MSIKSLPIVLALSAIGAIGYYCVGIDHFGLRSNEDERVPVESLVLDQAQFYRQTVEQISTSSAAAPRFPARADRSLTEWLEGWSASANVHGTAATEELLQELSAEVPQIGSATACLAFAGSISTLSKSIAEWSDSLDPSFNHFATYIFPDVSSQQIGCASVAIERLRLFNPELVNQGEKSFYSICRLCNKSHIGTIEQTNGAAALTCPNCDRSYELLAFKMDGKVCRVNDLLTGWTPPVRLPKPKTRVHEMVSIWKAVVDHVRYAKDLEGTRGNLDTWQLAEETWRYKNGDCEDSSILLADWLIARGFDARVVIGTTDKDEGHAWCVVLLDGTSYILETTNARPDLKQLPYAAKLRRHYHPDFQFNRKSVFYRKDFSRNVRYWSSNAWLQLDAK